MLVKENLMMMMREKEEQNKDLHNNFDDEIEALSLCDLPLTQSNNLEEHHLHTKKNNNDLSGGGGGGGLSDEDFFEFFNDFKTEMRAAEDIIFCGKLLPYRSPNDDLHSNHDQFVTNSKGGHDDDDDDDEEELDFKKKRLNSRSKSDSLNDLQKSQSSAKNQFLKNSYSLDYRKLKRVSSSKTIKNLLSEAKDDEENDQNQKCFGKNVFSFRSLSIPSSSYQSQSQQVKPKKQLVMFGVMKPPAEMELRDIRNRQNKRNPSSLFGGDETVSVKSNGGKSSSWSVFRALGCKGHENAVAAATTSLRCIPHV